MFYFLITVELGITTHPQNATVTEGENVTLSCNASGDPVPSISWTKNGSAISTSGDPRISFGVDNKQMTITNVSRSDSGRYRCEANNSNGTVTSNAATLEIQCKKTGLLLKSWNFNVEAKVRSFICATIWYRKTTKLNSLFYLFSRLLIFAIFAIE